MAVVIVSPSVVGVPERDTGMQSMPEHDTERSE